MIARCTLTAVLFLCVTWVMAQNSGDVYVDRKGVMRWGDTKKEVQGFGVNYTVPFAHAYRSAKKLGVDPKKAMDNDIYHFARLGLDAYRVHVWDTEISDSVGNLLGNEHLELFDYMISQMKARGMKFLITPIAFWGNGWPEPDEDTPGFSDKYGKEACLTNPDAIEAQANYLFQFLNHVNPHTGIAYKDDPDIVAFEVSNEPHHDQPAGKVTAYIEKMVGAMKKTGCKKPIFYNVSHSIHLVDAYYAAGIDGGTFQWYPTGLGSGEEIRGNLLPNVDHYNIPFKDHKAFQKGAKIVYEFDAADVGRSYIYPAMARSFRTAGIQWATHFAYDPTYLAYANTEYDTHYMNLVYAPQKALSLKICSEIFHRIPVHADFGKYPDNTEFGDFRVNYEYELAEMVTDEKFIYTNNTNTQPLHVERLKEIAGFGHSPVVRYEGRGAYFLDQLEPGVWRLEVLPDVFWIRNLFGENSLKKKVADIQWNSWSMKIDLPDLGVDFAIVGMNKDNDLKTNAIKSNFEVTPGTYILSQKGKQHGWTANSRFKNIRVGEFYAPESTVEGTGLIHRVTPEVTEGKDLLIKATVVSENKPQWVSLLAYAGGRPKSYTLERVKGNQYEVTIPAGDLKLGYFNYFLVVKAGGQAFTFPSGTETSPEDWDFYLNEMYKVKVLKTNSPLCLFDAKRDFNLLNMPWNPGVHLSPSPAPNKASLNIQMDELPIDDGNDDESYYAIRFFFGDRIAGRKSELTEFENLVVKGHSLKQEAAELEISLICKDGSAFGTKLNLKAQKGAYSVKLSELILTKIVTLPRPYPGFLPYYFEPGEVAKQLDLTHIETLQISLESKGGSGAGLSIESIWLEKRIEKNRPLSD